MITEKQVEQIIERLINRVEKANTKFLKSIGSSLKELKKLTPTKAQQLIQILKYGGKYEDIIKEISKLTDLNIKDIDNIFNNYAKKDQLFYEKFYKYRDVPFTPFEENLILKRQTQALSNIVKNEMYNFTRNNVLGYTINGQFYNLRETYNQLLDTALMNINQGKETFDQAMTSIIKEIGGSGLKTLNYESGRNIRLDSAIRMQLQSRLRELHYENQKIIADEIKADGVEITVHENPAPDHADIQGRQFSIDHYDDDGNFISGEYEKLQNGEIAKDYKGNNYTLDKNDKGSYRPIREMNCKHEEFTIVLGVSKPQYTDEQLQQIKEDNNKGFEYEGKHYTNYEGTQLQRNLERKIREQKDIQILAKSSDNTELIIKSQKNITNLTNKYRELSKISSLPTKMERLRVSGFKRTKINNYKEIEYARKNNAIWHSTENIEEILNSKTLMKPSIAVGKKINSDVKYGSQFIEFKPEFLENVNKSTILYKGDGGNKFRYNDNKFKNLMQTLKDKPNIYNELKFNQDIDISNYIKKVYIRQDESKKVIDLLKEKDIKYEIYKDYRIRSYKKKR